jgi:hypothetical protein
MPRKEIQMWKDVKGYEGLYQVSDKGEVRRLLYNKTRPVKPRDGQYNTVTLSKNGIKKSHAIHRMVAEAFLERPQGATEVNHKDGVKHHNNVENLEWVTQRENRLHAMNELNHFPFGKPARKVKCINADTGELIQEFPSLADAARAVGKMSARTGITLVCQGMQNKAYGYKWEYAD